MLLDKEFQVLIISKLFKIVFLVFDSIDVELEQVLIKTSVFELRDVPDDENDFEAFFRTQ